MDDITLARRAAAGDETAFGEIVEQYSRLIYNIILRSVASPEDAADISQETFLKAWRSLSSFRGDCALSTWLCRIAINCARDHLRAAGRHPTVSLTVSDDDGDDDRVADIPDSDPSRMPEEAAARQEDIAAVRAAIDALPDEQRLIVTLRDIEGLSYLRIAEILDLEMGTVKSRLNRARAAVKNFLIERNFSPAAASKNMNK